MGLWILKHLLLCQIDLKPSFQVGQPRDSGQDPTVPPSGQKEERAGEPSIGVTMTDDRNGLNWLQCILDSASAQDGRSQLRNVAGRVLMKLPRGKYTLGICVSLCECVWDRESKRGRGTPEVIWGRQAEDFIRLSKAPEVRNHLLGPTTSLASFFPSLDIWSARVPRLVLSCPQTSYSSFSPDKPVQLHRIPHMWSQQALAVCTSVSSSWAYQSTCCVGLLQD